MQTCWQWHCSKKIFSYLCTSIRPCIGWFRVGLPCRAATHWCVNERPFQSALMYRESAGKWHINVVHLPNRCHEPECHHIWINCGLLVRYHDTIKHLFGANRFNDISDTLETFDNSKAHWMEQLSGDNNAVGLCETLDLFRAIFHIDRTTSEFVLFDKVTDCLWIFAAEVTGSPSPFQ